MLASFYLFLLMAGAIQGVVMGILLFRARTSPQWKANRFLALILFFFAYRLIIETLYGLGIGGSNQWVYHIILEYNWIYGALIFFYIQALIIPKFQLQKKDWIHFLPVGVEFLFSNFIKAQNFFWDGTRESLSWAGYNGYRLWMHTPFQICITILLILFYTFYAQRLLNTNKTALKKEVTNRIQWTLWAYILFSILALLSALIDYFFLDFAFNPIHKYPTFISMTIITYWIGLQAIWYRNETLFIKKKKPIENQKQLIQIIQQLEKVMQVNKPYLNPTLDVKTLAQTINTKPYLLTKALNSQLSKKFNDYVNEYRVKEVTERINNEAYQHQSLLGIGLDAGFNSKASFNRIVKKITGQPPSALKKVK